jgi:hypothetical protein
VRRRRLVYERLDDLHAALPDVAADVQAGWSSALDHLPTALTA